MAVGQSTSRAVQYFDQLDLAVESVTGPKPPQAQRATSGADNGPLRAIQQQHGAGDCRLGGQAAGRQHVHERTLPQHDLPPPDQNHGSGHHYAQAPAELFPAPTHRLRSTLPRCYCCSKACLGIPKSSPHCIASSVAAFSYFSPGLPSLAEARPMAASRVRTGTRFVFETGLKNGEQLKVTSSRRLLCPAPEWVGRAPCRRSRTRSSRRPGA